MNLGEEFKGTVSREGSCMLPYEFRKLLKNAIASDEKNMILLKGQLTMTIKKIQGCTRYCIQNSMVGTYIPNCGALK